MSWQQKYFVIYDPSHLLKNIWNNFKKGDFVLHGNRIRWQHKVDFYNLIKVNRFIWHKSWEIDMLSFHHFGNVFEFSCSSFKSLSCSRNYNFGYPKHLPESAIYTAQFVEHFDDLFNTFNCQALKCSQRLGHAFNKSSGYHAFLQESFNFLDGVKTVEGNELSCLIWIEIIHSCTAFPLATTIWKKEEHFQFINHFLDPLEQNICCN